MKFDISQDKLELVIFKYLNKKNFVIKETNKNYYFLENEGDNNAQIRVRKEDMVCYVTHGLSNEIASFFSFEVPMSGYFLKRYVEVILNVKITNIFFPMGYGIPVIGVN